MIGKKSTNAAKLWMDLCAIRLSTSEVFTLETQDTPELRALELMGFVVSSDKCSGIAIKIKGHCSTYDGENLFCIKEGRHE